MSANDTQRKNCCSILYAAYYFCSSPKNATVLVSSLRASPAWLDMVREMNKDVLCDSVVWSDFALTTESAYSTEVEDNSPSTRVVDDDERSTSPTARRCSVNRHLPPRTLEEKYIPQQARKVLRRYFYDEFCKHLATEYGIPTIPVFCDRLKRGLQIDEDSYNHQCFVDAMLSDVRFVVAVEISRPSEDPVQAATVEDNKQTTTHTEIDERERTCPLPKESYDPIANIDDRISFESYDDYIYDENPLSDFSIATPTESYTYKLLEDYEKEKRERRSHTRDNEDPPSPTESYTYKLLEDYDKEKRENRHHTRHEKVPPPPTESYTYKLLENYEKKLERKERHHRVRGDKSEPVSLTMKTHQTNPEPMLEDDPTKHHDRLLGDESGSDLDDPTTTTTLPVVSSQLTPPVETGSSSRLVFSEDLVNVSNSGADVVVRPPKRPIKVNEKENDDCSPEKIPKLFVDIVNRPTKRQRKFNENDRAINRPPKRSNKFDENDKDDCSPNKRPKLYREIKENIDPNNDRQPVVSRSSRSFSDEQFEFADAELIVTDEKTVTDLEADTVMYVYRLKVRPNNSIIFTRIFRGAAPNSEPPINVENLTWKTSGLLKYLQNMFGENVSWLGRRNDPRVFEIRNLSVEVSFNDVPDLFVLLKRVKSSHDSPVRI